MNKPNPQLTEAGFKSWLDLAMRSGFPKRTLQDMQKLHPLRFQTILKGAKPEALTHEQA